MVGSFGRKTPLAPKAAKSVLGPCARRRRSQAADRQQPVLQRFVLPQFGCLAAERDASAFGRRGG